MPQVHTVIASLLLATIACNTDPISPRSGESSEFIMCTEQAEDPCLFCELADEQITCDLCSDDVCEPIDPRLGGCIGPYCAKCDFFLKPPAVTCFIGSPGSYCTGGCSTDGCGGFCR